MSGYGPRGGKRLAYLAPLVALVALAATPFCRVPLVSPLLAQVTEVSICGGCSCEPTAAAEAACEERNRLEWERAHPPRGAMEGICVAYPRDRQKPASDLAAAGIFSKVRFNEVKPAEFNEVGKAWMAFLDSTYPNSFYGQCFSQSGYDAESDLKRASQFHDGFPAARRVFFPDYGVAETPEEKEAAEKVRAVRDKIASLKAQVAAMKVNREVERIERERAAAEAERQRIAAEEKRKVDAIAEQIGPGKDAAAARLAAMNEELKALRPKPSARQCTTRTFTQPMSSSSPNQSNAFDSLMAAIARRSGANIGGSESVVSMTASGSPSCAKEKVAAIVWQPPVGNCLSCITEAQAKMLGWVPGSGWPPPKTEFVCRVSVQVVAEKCSSGSSTVTSQ